MAIPDIQPNFALETAIRLHGTPASLLLCWAPFGTMAGLLLASLATLGVTYLVNNYPELEWIVWRLPFFLALLGSSIGLYIRLFIPESLEYIMYYAEHPKPKVAGLFKQSLQYITSSFSRLMTIWLLFLA